jgi:CBS domain-containing membrane protein
MDNFIAWLRGFRPAPINAGRREKLIGCIGACVGLMITQWVCKFAFGELNPWFIAPMGASAVLMFAVPSSPLAQPWSIIGGNVVSALIGVTCAHWIPDQAAACGVAVMCAIGAMFALRCLHPPSGAVALMAVLGGPAVLESGYRFALLPVGANSALLLVTALVFNNVLRRRYPHPVILHLNAHRTADAPPTERLGVTRKDVDDALKEHAEPLDISPEDLEDIVLNAELHAYRRHAGILRCADIMSRDVITVRGDLPLTAAWELINRHHVKALPVVDAGGTLIGIVSLHDLIVGHGNTAPVPTLHHAERIDQLMSTHVLTATPTQALEELVPLFSDRGYHHLPVVDAQRHVVGMVTQSDLIAALYRAGVEKIAA